MFTDLRTRRTDSTQYAGWHGDKSYLYIILEAQYIKYEWSRDCYSVLNNLKVLSIGQLRDVLKTGHNYQSEEMCFLNWWIYYHSLLLVQLEKKQEEKDDKEGMWCGWKASYQCIPYERRACKPVSVAAYPLLGSPLDIPNICKFNGAQTFRTS